MPAILIVDDDHAFLDILQRAMTRRGFVVARACTVDEAIAAASEQDFAGIVLDLRIGEDSGLLCLPTLRQKQPDATILLLTGYASIATAVEAVKRGVDEGADLVICDTAGRLHTKTDLMDELKKVRRVMDKAMPGCPHETWMVLDATTGQNAITQAKTFKDAMEITGIVITKLDGSAKGGVILGICDELKVPVRYIGVGEQLQDLRPFDANAFVAALYDDTE